MAILHLLHQSQILATLCLYLPPIMYPVVLVRILGLLKLSLVPLVQFLLLPMLLLLLHLQRESPPETKSLLMSGSPTGSRLTTGLQIIAFHLLLMSTGILSLRLLVAVGDDGDELQTAGVHLSKRGKGYINYYSPGVHLSMRGRAWGASTELQAPYIQETKHRPCCAVT